MGSDVGQDTRLIKLQVQEQAVDFSGTPPDYEGRIELDPTLLDVERLETALETGRFELSNSRVHQNLVLHDLSCSMHHSQYFFVSSAIWLEVLIAQPISQ